MKNIKKSTLVIGFAVLIFILLSGVTFYIVQSLNAVPVEPMEARDMPGFSHDELNIQGADGKPVPFNVELATTPKEAEYGLMFRRSIDPQTGMLFLWDPDHPVSMWMKNTYVPLDMLFIRRDGTIVKIVTHTVPLNLTPISSGETVHGVLEVKAGEVDRLGIKTGNKVLFWAFSTAP